MIETTPLSFGIAVCALLVTGVLVGLLWRRRDRPTAWPLLGFAAVLSLVVASDVAVTHLGPTRSVVARLGGEDAVTGVGRAVVSVGYLVAFGLWTVFAFEYTGRGDSTTTAVRAAVGGVWLATVSVFAISATALLSTAAANVFYNTALIGVLVLAVVGVFLVVDESSRLGPLPRREALATAAAVAVVIPSPLLYFAADGTLGLTGPVLLSGAVLVGTLRQGTPLTTLPAASVVGRDRVVTEMRDGVFVVGRDRTVRDVNPSGVALVGTDRDAVVDAGWSALFPGAPGPARVAQSTRPVEIERGDTVVAATASPIRDGQGRLLGHLVVCRDVTARRERERRLAVLSRFLVDTAAEEMDDVTERAARLADGVPDPERRRRLGADVWTTATDLVTMVSYAREIERALADPERRDSDVAAVLDRVAAATASTDAALSVDADGTDAHAAVMPSLLAPVLRLLVVEVLAAPPGALACTVRTDADEDEVVVTVGPAPGDADDRPTAPESTADDPGGPADGDGTASAGTPGHAAGGPEGDRPTDDPDGRARAPDAGRSTVGVRLARLGLESAGGTVAVSRDGTDGESTSPAVSATVRLPAVQERSTRASTTGVTGAAPATEPDPGGEPWS